MNTCSIHIQISVHYDTTYPRHHVVFGILVLLLQKLHSLCHMYNSDYIAIPLQRQLQKSVLNTNQRSKLTDRVVIIIPYGIKRYMELNFMILRLMPEP